MAIDSTISGTSSTASTVIVRAGGTAILIALLSLAAWDVGWGSAYTDPILFRPGRIVCADPLLLPEVGALVIVRDDAEALLAAEHARVTDEVLERHEVPLLPDDERHAQRKAAAGLVESARA